jgi:hypothetical protein
VKHWATAEKSGPEWYGWKFTIKQTQEATRKKTNTTLELKDLFE